MKLSCTLQVIEEAFSAAAFAEENESQAGLDLLQKQEAERKQPRRSASAGSENGLAPLTSAA